MQHLELDPKMIRLAGDWSAKEDTMFTLNKLGKALQNPGATYDVLSWESFISKEEEDKLTREGKLPKHGQTELILGKDSKVVARDRMDESCAGVSKVNEMETLRARLDLRARAAEMIDVARYTTMRSLSDRDYSKLNTERASPLRQGVAGDNLQASEPRSGKP